MKQRPNPKDMGARGIGAFLTHMVVDQRVVAFTQNQVLSGLLFLYREVLGKAAQAGLAVSVQGMSQKPGFWAPLKRNGPRLEGFS
jgi:hypothetical protein